MADVKTDFSFDLNQRVRLAGTAEEGVIIGRSEYLAGEPMYLLRYTAADGRKTDAWWGQSAIVAVDAAP